MNTSNILYTSVIPFRVMPYIFQKGSRYGTFFLECLCAVMQSHSYLILSNMAFLDDDKLLTTR